MQNIKKLITLLQSLRSEEKGCPWTRAQDATTLLPLTIEEVYELAEAVDSGEPDAIKYELADLLYHVLFYCQMAEESKQFSLEEVAETMIAKQEARRPPSSEYNNFDEASMNLYWQAQKHKKLSDQSYLASIPKHQPPVNIAMRLQTKASEVGFDWPNETTVLEKVNEELNELSEAIQTNDHKSQQEELGDLMFVLINLARHLKIDPETALRQANQKFRQRFDFIEKQLKVVEKNLFEATTEEMEVLWEEAKK